MTISAELDHHRALAHFTAAGHAFPAIPPGKNTVWHHFTLPDGSPAVLVNQSGLIPTAADNEEQVNGCSLIVALDAPSEDAARAALEAALADLLEF